MICALCDRNMFPEDTGEPWLRFKDKPICFDCYIGITPQIYKMSGAGDGGLINLIFKTVLSSSHNRKKRLPIRNYRSVFKKLQNKYNFSCVHCATTENLTIDHVYPVKLGGSDDINNLQILCRSCNSKKGIKIPRGEWKENNE